ncbi:hydrogenase maturation nickel metallochaperone HypA [Superficieibacter electus]|uniref:Hydrogenase maturation factor HypA n=1 Tax=Superficieibacter electus TaxID=2022662 RepID=A0A2P5GNB8_9ENTR|nr:hydrogenase maturation nickel metallochaperone HypA [Superficieibacter electus]POP43599.1 hydrogenase maturation nickel metallochaperone HypA [Superficieibacter electus]POP48067.1 hydrogenase maturation nickel metallochaperone HypA [Superficieibacter electus]
MHELTLALNIVQILEEQAVSRKFNRVKQVWLEMGTQSCVEESALRFGLTSATRNTLAEDAQFHIVQTPTRGWCHSCCQVFETRQPTAGCPLCHSVQIQHEQADALRIRELEVE